MAMPMKNEPITLIIRMLNGKLVPNNNEIFKYDRHKYQEYKNNFIEVKDLGKETALDVIKRKKSKFSTFEKISVCK